MRDDEPFYIHEGTGFLEGMRIEDLYDPAKFYELDPSIGYFQVMLTGKKLSYYAPLPKCGNLDDSLDVSFQLVNFKLGCLGREIDNSTETRNLLQMD